MAPPTGNVVDGQAPRPPCSQLRWDLTAEQIEAMAAELTESTKLVYDRVGAQERGEVSYENTLKALADVEVEYTVNVCTARNQHKEQIWKSKLSQGQPFGSRSSCLPKAVPAFMWHKRSKKDPRNSHLLPRFSLGPSLHGPCFLLGYFGGANPGGNFWGEQIPVGFFRGK
uniref:Thimet oligopeptidase 1 n=1 Tax=Cyanoderma ruficeps TaxID=181631 RepID=A0A8C3QLG3_9PASS